MQNNSKLNTVLLIILIILAALCLWKISDDNREEENNSNEIKTEQTENNNDEKEEVSDQETTTYQYPSSGPAFFTMEAKGNPTVTTSSVKWFFLDPQELILFGTPLDSLVGQDILVSMT